MIVRVTSMNVTLEHDNLEAAIELLRASAENGFPCTVEVVR